MSRGERVDRPLKRSEYEIVFITRQAKKDWRDCLATSERRRRRLGPPHERTDA
jgi:hypothetical protein